MGRIERMHNLLQKGEVSSRELTESYLQAIDRDNPRFNAYVTITPDLALDQANKADEIIARKEGFSPLCGIPMSLKDNISTKGIETTCCSQMLKGYKPLYDATAWQRLQSKGAVLLGKVNLDEFAMGSSTRTSCFKESKNPFDTDRTPGGSSGGSATSVAANLCGYSLGSDTGGSVRQPASLCGVVGFKPTYGTISRRGLIAFASSLDQVGIVTDSIEDCALVYDAIAGFDPLDPTTSRHYVPDTYRGLERSIKGRKIGIVKEIFEYATDEVLILVKEAVRVYKEMGAEIVEISIPEIDYSLPVYYILACAEASSNLARYDGIRYGYCTDKPYDSIKDMVRKNRTEAMGNEVKRRILLGTYVLSKGYGEEYYKKAQTMRDLICRAFSEAFSKCDVMLSSTTPTVAPKFGGEMSVAEDKYPADICTVPVNIGGLPAVTLCAGQSPSGLPVGIQLIGNRFCERDILNFAFAYQQQAKIICATDWGFEI